MYTTLSVVYFEMLEIALMRISVDKYPFSASEVATYCWWLNWHVYCRTMILSAKMNALSWQSAGQTDSEYEELQRRWIPCTSLSVDASSPLCQSVGMHLPTLFSCVVFSVMQSFYSMFCRFYIISHFLCWTSVTSKFVIVTLRCAFS